MAQLIITNSKYVIAIGMLLFAASGLVRVWLDQNRWHCLDTVHSILVFVIQFFSYLTIYAEKREIDYLFYYAFSQLVLFAVMVLFRMLYPRINRLLLNCQQLLLGTGLVILVRLDYDKALRQLIIAAVSLAAAMLAVWFVRQERRLLKKRFMVPALIGLLSLGIVLLYGQVTNGSKISFTLLGITFQPSELVKLLYVLFLAAMLWKKVTFKKILFSALLAAAHVIILVCSKDLGGALIYYVAYVFLIFFATGQARYLFLGAGIGAGASCAAYLLFSHVQERVQAWLDPWSVIDSIGYQVTQSLFALSRGGLFGLGIGQGTPKDIPYVDTDFIFSAVTEEMGLLFAIGLILVYLICFFQCLRIAAAHRDRFCRLLSSGYAILLIFQTFLTIGGGIKFIPLTGVTLPLISYGGTSVLTTLLLFAVIQGIGLEQAEYELKQGAGQDDEEDNRSGGYGAFYDEDADYDTTESEGYDDDDEPYVDDTDDDDLDVWWDSDDYEGPED